MEPETRSLAEVERHALSGEPETQSLAEVERHALSGAGGLWGGQTVFLELALMARKPASLSQMCDRCLCYLIFIDNKEIVRMVSHSVTAAS